MRHSISEIWSPGRLRLPLFKDSGSDGGGGDGGGSNDSGDGGFFGYDSFGDMFDGGGPGASGDSYSTQDNTALDTNNDGHISSAEAKSGTGSSNLAGGIDGSGDGGFFGYTSFADMFDGGGPGKAGDTFSTQDNSAFDSNDDGYISFEEASTGQNGNNNLPGGIDGSNNIDNTNNTNTSFNDATSFNDESSDGGGSGVNTDPVVTDPVVTDPVVTDPVVTDPVATDPVGDNTAQIIADLQAQLDALSNQAPQTEVVYRDTVNNSTTSLPDDYLTEEALARYLKDLNLNSNAYDPAAFLNAYGFALQPGFEGDTIQTYLSPDGLYMRRAVRDRDTGEIRYINVPIGSGAINGNAGIEQWRQNRRTGFGTFV